MSEIIECNTKAVAIFVDGNLKAYILFPTEQVSYEEYNAALVGFSEGERCLVIAKTQMISANASSYHKWDAKNRYHQYSFSFSNLSTLDPELHAGTLEYEYFDNEKGGDKALWKSEMENVERVIECMPLVPSVNNMWKLADKGDLTLDLNFPRGDRWDGKLV